MRATAKQYQECGRPARTDRASRPIVVRAITAGRDARRARGARPHLATPDPALAPRQFDGEADPLRPRCMPRFADQLALREEEISESSGTDHLRLPEAAAPSERFQAPAAVVDDEDRAP